MHVRMQLLVANAVSVRFSSNCRNFQFLQFYWISTKDRDETVDFVFVSCINDGFLSVKGVLWGVYFPF